MDRRHRTAPSTTFCCFQTHAADPRRRMSWMIRSLGWCRSDHAGGCRVDQGTDMDHPGILGLVARPLPVRDWILQRTLEQKEIFAYGRLRLTAKASALYLATRQPLWTYLRECGARFSAGSSKGASPFTGQEGMHSCCRRIAGWSPEHGENAVSVNKSINMNGLWYLDGAGEP